MDYVAIHESIRPRRFLSYSHKDSGFRDRHFRGLLREALWIDREQLAVGECWRDEIVRGIRDCDEFVLLVSDHSLASSEVMRELHIAKDLGKTLLLIAIPPLNARFQVPFASEIDHLTLLTLSSAAVERELQRLFSREWVSPRASAIPASHVKIRAARSLWPAFSAAPIDQAFMQHCERLRTAAIGCGDASPILLNYGLAECRLRHYAVGLSYVRRYAEAASCLAGWYFLGLCLAQRRSLRALTVQDTEDGRRAVERASLLGHNPLVQLLGALYEVCGCNGSTRRIADALSHLESMRSALREEPSEHLRFFSETHASWDDLREVSTRARALFRELAS